MAVGGAVIAAQSGDSIRQRLEHCVTALRLAARVIAEAGGGETGTSEDQSRIEVVLKRLQSAQSRAAAVVLIAEVGQIDSALAALANDTEALVQFGRALHGGEGASTRSFLEGLEAELAEASGLLQKCDAARGGVDSATEALTTLLIQFQQTVAGLSETIEDIVMIGTNAGLLAARLGSDGRGLVVIAGEVKSVAAHIATDATRLNPIFTSMRDASRDLRDRDHRGAAEMADLDRAMRLSLEQMRGSATRLGATLDRLARDGARFADVVDECRRMFASAAAAGETIEDAADALDPAASKRRLVADGDSAAIEDALRRQVWPTYTMSAERQIHREILREFGFESVGAAEAA
jgi:hypothetical protein